MTFAKLSGWVLGIGIGLAVGGSAEAGLIKSAGSASTSNKGTVTTSGQTQILATIDPYNIVKFQLDYKFEADKVDFVSLQGVNGYIIDGYTVVIAGSLGLISNIQGHYPGFEFAPTPIPVTFDVGEEGPALAPPSLPGEVDMFSILFTDKNTAVQKIFTVLAGDEQDFMTGFDPSTGQFAVVAGPQNIDPKDLIIPANAAPGVYGAGPAGAPVPAAVWMGLVAGGVVMVRARHRKLAA